MSITVDNGELDEDGFSVSSQAYGFQIVLTALDESAEDVVYRLTYSLP